MKISNKRLALDNPWATVVSEFHCLSREKYVSVHQRGRLIEQRNPFCLIVFNFPRFLLKEVEIYEILLA